jgi:hypothetical protein
MKKVSCCLILVFFLLSGGLLFGQESEIESSYRLDENGRILQRISWERSNAYYYEVEIEQQVAAGEWNLVEKPKTENLFVEVSLAPGMYRYRILSYNVLDRVAATSEWAGIRVFVTRDPKVERTIPEAYYVENMADDFTLTLEGVNLMENADVYLIAKKEGAGRIMPESVQYSESENTITLTVRTVGLGLGPYDIVVTNPGKLQTVYEGFSVTFRHKVDVNVSLGYMPLIPLSGYIYDTFSSPVYPASFYGRISVVPFKYLWGFLGAEFTPQFAIMKTEADTYTVNGTMMSFAFDALYQYWFYTRTMALNFRLGGGFTAITGINFEHNDGSTSDEVTTVLSMMNLGASIEWFVWRSLFVEGGLEFVQHFTKINPAPGMLKITVGAGWRF